MSDWGVDWRGLFLSSTGRLARNPFLLAAGILIGVETLYEGLFNLIAHWITGWIVYPVIIYASACVLSKRLHDRGRSGWWAALILFSIIVGWPHPRGFFFLLFPIVAIWAIVELAVLPGEQGANRFGPNPLRSGIMV